MAYATQIRRPSSVQALLENSGYARHRSMMRRSSRHVVEHEQPCADMRRGEHGERRYRAWGPRTWAGRRPREVDSPGACWSSADRAYQVTLAVDLDRSSGAFTLWRRRQTVAFDLRGVSPQSERRDRARSRARARAVGAWHDEGSTRAPVSTTSWVLSARAWPGRQESVESSTRDGGSGRSRGHRAVRATAAPPGPVAAPRQAPPTVARRRPSSGGDEAAPAAAASGSIGTALHV